MTGRRALPVAVLACLAGAGLVLLAAGQPWARATAGGGPAGVVTVQVSGADVIAVVSGLGVLALAGSVALLATRRLGRRLVGTVLALAGLGIVVGALAGRADPGPALRETAGKATGRIGAPVTDVVTTGWPWPAVAGGLLVLAVGVAAAVLGPGWSVMSSRYERDGGAAALAAGPATGAPERTSGEPATTPTRDAWAALDQGTDPTV
jgi:uncharacterized membrane protein (TIGR02234 family)